MLLNFARQLNIMTPYLEQLVHNRDAFYNSVQNEYLTILKSTEINAKQLVLASINSGRTDYKSETLKGLSIEINTLRDELYTTKFDSNGVYYYSAVMSRGKDIPNPDISVFKQKTQTLYCFCEETRNILSLRNIILDNLDPSEVSIVPFFDRLYVSYNEFRDLSSSHQSIYLRTSELVDQFNSKSSDLIKMKIKDITEEFQKIISCINTFTSLNSKGIQRVLNEGSIDMDVVNMTTEILNKSPSTDITFTVEEINEYKRKYRKCLVSVLDYIYMTMKNM